MSDNTLIGQASLASRGIAGRLDQVRQAMQRAYGIDYNAPLDESWPNNVYHTVPVAYHVLEAMRIHGETENYQALRSTLRGAHVAFRDLVSVIEEIEAITIRNDNGEPEATPSPAPQQIALIDIRTNRPIPGGGVQPAHDRQQLLEIISGHERGLRTALQDLRTATSDLQRVPSAVLKAMNEAEGFVNEIEGLDDSADDSQLREIMMAAPEVLGDLHGMLEEYQDTAVDDEFEDEGNDGHNPEDDYDRQASEQLLADHIDPRLRQPQPHLQYGGNEVGEAATGARAQGEDTNAGTSQARPVLQPITAAQQFPATQIRTWAEIQAEEDDAEWEVDDQYVPDPEQDPVAEEDSEIEAGAEVADPSSSPKGRGSPRKASQALRNQHAQNEAKRSAAAQLKADNTKKAAAARDKGTKERGTKKKPQKKGGDESDGEDSIIKKGRRKDDESDDDQSGEHIPATTSRATRASSKATETAQDQQDKTTSNIVKTSTKTGHRKRPTAADLFDSATRDKVKSTSSPRKRLKHVVFDLTDSQADVVSISRDEFVQSTQRNLGKQVRDNIADLKKTARAQVGQLYADHGLQLSNADTEVAPASERKRKRTLSTSPPTSSPAKKAKSTSPSPPAPVPNQPPTLSTISSKIDSWASNATNDPTAQTAADNAKTFFEFIWEVDDSPVGPNSEDNECVAACCLFLGFMRRKTMRQIASLTGLSCREVGRGDRIVRKVNDRRDDYVGTRRNPT